jgi:ribosomal protein S8
MDRIDKKIISVLEEGKNYNMVEVMVKSYTKESSRVFKRRLENLQKKGFINFNQDRLNKRKSYVISIKDRLNLGVDL